MHTIKVIGRVIFVGAFLRFGVAFLLRSTFLWLEYLILDIQHAGMPKMGQGGFWRVQLLPWLCEVLVLRLVWAVVGGDTGYEASG